MKITCINVYSMSEVLRMEIADWVKTFEGVIFSPRQKSDSISPSAQGPLCPQMSTLNVGVLFVAIGLYHLYP